MFGATGGTGLELVRQARDAGHEVTACSRSPAPAPVDGVRWVRADLLDPSTLGSAVAGQDVVVSAAGPRGRGPTELFSRGVANLAAAMRSAGVPRLLVVSAVAHDPTAVVPFPFTLLMHWVVRPVLRETFADVARMEAALPACGLSWTAVRPPMLNDGPATGRVRVGPPNAHLRHPVRISRADLAETVLRLIGEPTAERAWVEVAW